MLRDIWIKNNRNTPSLLLLFWLQNAVRLNIASLKRKQGKSANSNFCAQFKKSKQLVLFSCHVYSISKWRSINNFVLTNSFREVEPVRHGNEFLCDIETFHFAAIACKICFRVLKTLVPSLKYSIKIQLNYNSINKNEDI